MKKSKYLEMKEIETQNFQISKECLTSTLRVLKMPINRQFLSHSTSKRTLLDKPNERESDKDLIFSNY